MEHIWREYFRQLWSGDEIRKTGDCENSGNERVSERIDLMEVENEVVMEMLNERRVKKNLVESYCGGIVEM